MMGEKETPCEVHGVWGFFFCGWCWENAYLGTDGCEREL